MTSELTPLRKAAILLQSLDEATADVLMRRMTPDETQSVWRELAALGHIEPETRQRVVSEVISRHFGF